MPATRGGRITKITMTHTQDVVKPSHKQLSLSLPQLYLAAPLAVVAFVGCASMAGFAYSHLVQRGGDAARNSVPSETTTRGEIDLTGEWAFCPAAPGRESAP